MAVLCAVCVQLLTVYIPEESEVQKELASSSYELETSIESKLQFCGQWQVSHATERQSNARKQLQKWLSSYPQTNLMNGSDTALY